LKSVYINFLKNINITPKDLVLSGIYTGEKSLHAVTSDGDLKRWEDFY
jgi:hypothetical protein